MTDLYWVTQDGIVKPLDAIHCKDEERELQNLLEKNLDLIPGAQINPEEP